MPQTSAIYAAARIRVLEKRLISREDMLRLVDSDLQSALRMLSEWGYGGENVGSDDVDKLFSGELKRARDTVNELTVNETLTNVFLMREDMVNLKILLKLKAQGKMDGAEKLLSTNCIFEPKLLALMVDSLDFAVLPKLIADGIADAAQLLKDEKRPTAQELSLAVDRAYYSYALSLKNDFVREYFAAECDFANLSAYFRLKEYGADAAELKKALMPAGSILHAALLEAYETEDDSRAQRLLEAAVPAALSVAVREAYENKRVFPIELARDNYAVQLIRKGKWDMETVLPVISYYLARVFESRSVRLIITLKRNGISNSIISERLREMYG